jgi:hypothetical protein
MALYAKASGLDEVIVKQCLLHDASEAYTGDMVSPLKALCPEFKAIEKKIQTAIYLKYGLPEETMKEVKYLDLRIMVTEKRKLFPEDAARWELEEHVEPLDMILVPRTNYDTVGKADSDIFRLPRLHDDLDDMHRWPMSMHTEYLRNLNEVFKDA